MVIKDTVIRYSFGLALAVAGSACATEGDDLGALEVVDDDGDDGDDDLVFRLGGQALVDRANAIKAAHAGHANINNPVLFAGIASAETGLAHCYDEYTLGIRCQANYTSADCGGGYVLAGAHDVGGCPQGGLGMFQFDDGFQWETYSNWLAGKWPQGAVVGRDVTTLSGNIQASIDFVLYKAWWSDFTPLFGNYQSMYDWINGIQPIDGDPDFETWLGFLAYNYNGAIPYTPGWESVKNKYRTHTLAMYNDLGGWAFWYGGGGGPPPPPPPPPPAASCSPAGGLWCGGNGVSGDPNILYECNDGALVVKEVCQNGCLAAPAGFPDSCSAPNPASTDCSCASGKYHNGDDIPPGATYCGFRVCGMDGNVWECNTTNNWTPTGLTCGAGACSCPSGAHLDGTDILTQHTECHMQVCGGGNTWYTCESGGWDAVDGSYCTMGPGPGPGPSPVPDSCVGSCGTISGSCWCDSSCATFGDCCPDKLAVCG